MRAITFAALAVPLLVAGCDKLGCMPIGAEKVAREAISGQLKAPATARFIDVTTIETGPHEYSVIGKVDAENSYGVPLRMTFSSSISCTASNSNYIVRSADILGAQ